MTTQQADDWERRERLAAERMALVWAIQCRPTRSKAYRRVRAIARVATYSALGALSAALGWAFVMVLIAALGH